MAKGNYPVTRTTSTALPRTASPMSGSPNVAAGKGKVQNLSVGKMASTGHVTLGTSHGQHNVAHATKGAGVAHKMR